MMLGAARMVITGGSIYLLRFARVVAVRDQDETALAVLALVAVVVHRF